MGNMYKNDQRTIVYNDRKLWKQPKCTSVNRMGKLCDISIIIKKKTILRGESENDIVNQTYHIE